MVPPNLRCRKSSAAFLPLTPAIRPAPHGWLRGGLPFSAAARPFSRSIPGAHSLFLRQAKPDSSPSQPVFLIQYSIDPPLRFVKSFSRFSPIRYVADRNRDCCFLLLQEEKRCRSLRQKSRINRQNVYKYAENYSKRQKKMVLFVTIFPLSLEFFENKVYNKRKHTGAKRRSGAKQQLRGAPMCFFTGRVLPPMTRQPLFGGVCERT